MEADPLEIAREAVARADAYAPFDAKQVAYWASGDASPEEAERMLDEAYAVRPRGIERPDDELAAVSRALIAKHAEVSALEGLLRECAPVLEGTAKVHAKRGRMVQATDVRNILSRLDAALTPDRKAQS